MTNHQATGPRTEEGKARSSQNALKSGIYSQAIVIHGENFEHYEHLTAEYFQRFFPTTPELRDALDRLVLCVWFLRRYARIQAQLFRVAMEPIPSSIAPAGQAFTAIDQQLTRLQRIVNSTQRNHSLTLKEVERLHKLASEPLPEPAQPQPQEPISQRAEFVSSTPATPAPTGPQQPAVIGKLAPDPFETGWYSQRPA
jgi:hypothetical protein